MMCCYKERESDKDFINISLQIFGEAKASFFMEDSNKRHMV